MTRFNFYDHILRKTHSHLHLENPVRYRKQSMLTEVKRQPWCPGNQSELQTMIMLKNSRGHQM